MADVALVRAADQAGPPAKKRDPDEELARLEAEIALKRARVAASLGELRRRVDGALSWRHWVKSHPLLCVGAGLCLGFIVGSRVGRGWRRADR